MSIRAHSGRILGVFIMATFTFTASANKAGKVTATADKVAATLNQFSDSALLGAALTGRGTIAKMARVAVKGTATTLDTLLNMPALDGSQWGDMFALLRAEFGVACWARESMKGKKGAVAFMAAVVADRQARHLRAEGEKQTAATMKAWQHAENIAQQVQILFEASEAAAMTARHAAVTEEVTA